jgi:hypothetical protein
MTKADEEMKWYKHILKLLRHERIPFLIGGAYALWKYTGVRRPTKDLDLFMRPRHLEHTLKIIQKTGVKTELTARHWIGKAFHKEYLVDFIVGLANGVGQVDDVWFLNRQKKYLFGLMLPFMAPEEMIWSKAFVMERDRFDGADIAHLFLTEGKTLDWKRLMNHFTSHEEVLLSHLSLFRYIYPHARKLIPNYVESRLRDVAAKTASSSPRLCRGTLFSRTQYVADVERLGYEDARLPPHGVLTPQQILE